MVLQLTRDHACSRVTYAMVPKTSQSTWLVTPRKFLAPAQVAVLRAQLAGEFGRGMEHRDTRAVRNAALIETLLGSGLRVSEACALRIGELFLDGSNPSLLVRRGKGGRRRLVPIPTRLAAQLAMYVRWQRELGLATDDDAPLFSARCGHITRSAVHRCWKDALQRANLPTHWGVHATRHSYAVEVYGRSKDLRLTQRLLGHASPTTTMVYTALLDDTIREGVESLWS